MLHAPAHVVVDAHGVATGAAFAMMPERPAAKQRSQGAFDPLGIGPAQADAQIWRLRALPFRYTFSAAHPFSGCVQMLKRVSVPVFLVAAMACGGTGTTTSSSPTPTPTATTFSLSGRITDSATSNGISGANVSIADSQNAGKSATADSLGNYSFSGLQQGGFTVNAAADGYTSSSKGLMLTSNQTLSFQLSRVCDPWPDEIADMLARLPLPVGICLRYDPIRGSSYDETSLVVTVTTGPDPNPYGKISTMAHELGHAHQHWLSQSIGSPTIHDWTRTREGQAYLDAGGWAAVANCGSPANRTCWRQDIAFCER
ncbi:MAG TPA: carboxypeptidase-like regulatory domain-containing protein, partial [Phycisphaerae bacterium]